MGSIITVILGKDDLQPFMKMYFGKVLNDKGIKPSIFTIMHRPTLVNESVSDEKWLGMRNKMGYA